jgi:hypothetical protein
MAAGINAAPVRNPGLRVSAEPAPQRQGWALRVRIPLPYTVCLVGGMAIGVIFGDRVFPELEAMFGDPVTDIFLGAMGALFAAIAYETVAMFLRPD